MDLVKTNLHVLFPSDMITIKIKKEIKYEAKIIYATWLHTFLVSEKTVAAEQIRISCLD